MTDPRSFEARLQNALLRYTVDPRGAVDAAAVARGIAAGSRPRHVRSIVSDRTEAGRSWRLVFLLVVGLLVTLVGGVLLVGGGLVRPSLPVVVPATSDVPRAVGLNGLIAFCRGDHPDTRVHLMNPDGTADRELIKGTGAVFSADGTALTYITGWPHDTTVFVADPDGSNPRQVPDIGGESGGQEHVLSPDGTTIAWFDRRNPGGRPGSIMGFRHPAIRITPLDGGPVRQLTDGSEIDDPHATGLTWSPDGRSIAFAGLTELGDGAYRSAIHVVDVPTGEVRRLTERRGTDDVGIAWSPDGRRIGFTALPDGADPTPGAPGVNQDLFIIDADGTNERNVTDAPGIERNPVWSPDGSRIAYVAWDGSAVRSRILTLGGSASGSQALAGPVAAKVIWSPDGSTILYLNERTMSTIDAGFRRPPVELARVGESGCASWQRVEP